MANPSTTLQVQVFVQDIYDIATGKWANILGFTTPEYYQAVVTQQVFEYDTSNNSSATPYPLFVDDAAAIAYFGPIVGANFLSLVNTALGFSYFTAYNVTQIDPPAAQALASYVPNSTTVNGHPLSSNVTVAYGDLTGNPSFAAVATSGSYTDLSNKPTIPTVNTPSFNFPTRSLNSAFQISTTQNAFVSYAVDIVPTLSLTSGQQGTVYLRYADDSGLTTNVKTVQSGTNGNTGALTIGLSLGQPISATLTGMIPAGKYVKLVTENNTGTPTFTYRSAQEVLL